MGYAKKVLIDRVPEGKVSSGGLGEEADTAADEGIADAVGEGVWGGVEVEA